MSWLELDGAVNARDLGGLPTIDGRTTRSRVLLRSDDLQALSPADVQQLLDHGVRTVLDLRTTAELEALGPDKLAGVEGVRELHLDLVPMGREERDRTVQERLLPGGDQPAVVDSTYGHYVHDARDAMAAALRAIADPRSGAVLVHCAAGKDRTGVVVALALSLVGVRRDAVVADYVRSAERIEAIRDRLAKEPVYGLDLSPETLDKMRPRPEGIEAFLDHVDREYGGVHELAATLGVDEETLAALSRRLLEPRP